VSESKETEPGAGAQETTEAEAETEAETEAKAEAETEAEADEQAPTEAKPAKKKKKARDTGEPETIKDRNERVRAEAAEKRRARRERPQPTSAPRRNLDASEMMDDALARSTHAAAGFLRRHFNKVQWVIMLGLAGWIAWEVYSWRHTRQAEKATDALFKALSAESGRVTGGPDAAEAGEGDTRHSFATDEERLKAAQKEYQLASSVAGPASAVLAILGEAGVAYDLGKYKEAEAAYEKVKQHPAFGTDTDIRGRTLEGLGMALEAQKKDDAALKAFKELSSMDAANFSALGSYHQARLLKGQGKNEDAVKLLDKAVAKLELLKDTPAAIKYVRMSVMELLEELDPKKARELQQKLLPADILKQLQDAAKKAGVTPGGATPMPVMPGLPIEDAPALPEQPSEQPPAPGPLRDDAPAPEAPSPAPSGAP
jgi:tetratricopeptide (TPR) repeat protein